MDDFPRRPRQEMLDRLNCIKELVRSGPMPYSSKVRGFIDAGLYGEADVKNAIMTSRRLAKSEPDEQNDATDGMKHSMVGRDLDGRPFYVCGKIILLSDDMRAFYIITAHLARDRKERD